LSPTMSSVEATAQLDRAKPLSLPEVMAAIVP
jgi:hypothetical protein